MTSDGELKALVRMTNLLIFVTVFFLGWSVGYTKAERDCQRGVLSHTERAR